MTKRLPIGGDLEVAIKCDPSKQYFPIYPK